jgi:hypothetical protein
VDDKLQYYCDDLEEMWNKTEIRRFLWYFLTFSWMDWDKPQKNLGVLVMASFVVHAQV